MKKLLLSLFAALISLAASAQYATVPQGELKARGSRIYCDGAMLSKDKAAAVFSDFGGIDRSEEYLHYRSAYKAGVGLSVGGASLAVLGGATCVVSSAVVLVAVPFAAIGGGDIPDEVKGATGVAIGSAVAGTAGILMMLAGIPTASVYQSRIKKMAKGYNELGTKQEPVVSFRTASSGIGVAIVF